MIFQELEHLTWEKRLRNLGLFILEKTRLKGILSTCINKYLVGGDEKEKARLPSGVP